MEQPFHNFSELFAQLGLGNSPEEIETFLLKQSPLSSEVKLADAPFWSAAQADFLQQALYDDGDWAEIVDALNAALRDKKLK
jgi:hypothetical protein